MPASSRPRPALFRALGRAEPPQSIQIDGHTYQLDHLYKHDSWAATARYRGAHGSVVCKFNRTHSILGLPMKWLGRGLARREALVLERLAGLPGIPPGCGTIWADGLTCEHAVAHEYIPGRPLSKDVVLSDHFFEGLHTALRSIHRRGLAYVDLHKRENVLVGEDGQPYLIDFQVSFGLWHPRWARLNWVRNVLQALQDADRYHLAKHIKRCRPDQAHLLAELGDGRRPWWIEVHRFFAVPLRQLRRRLLTALGVRQKGGQATTELFPEEAVRQEQRRAA